MTVPTPPFDNQTGAPMAGFVCAHCGGRELFETKFTRQLVVAFDESGFIKTTNLDDLDVLELGYECAECGRVLTQETLVRR